MLAELVGHAAATEEFLDRWRTPGDLASKTWEERFGETRYATVGTEAWNALLAATGLRPEAVDVLLVAGTHERAARSVLKKTGVPAERLHDPFVRTLGNAGAAQPALLLASALENARPGQTIALLVLADGADAFLWRTTDALATHTGPTPTVADQIAQGALLPYGRYLAWRGFLPVEPPRRPEPARTSASAAARATAWKFALVGSQNTDPQHGSKQTESQHTDSQHPEPHHPVHLPPSPFDTAPTRPPTPRAPSSPSPSTASPTPPALRSSSRSSISTAAAGSRSS
ncbi:3-oxoacyl-[acyl-carrier-protein] synthase III C-terminal domain-containing protein [Catenulispora yoronensis]